MGFDTSHHPVDVALVQQRLLPFVRGEGSIDDLVERAVHLAQLRFRANAWGLGLVRLENEASAEARKRQPPPKRSLWSRLAGAPAPTASPVPRDPRFAKFESQLHVWGRPYFIGADTATEVSAALDRYQSATVGQVDALAAESLQQLVPELADQVKPSTEGHLPEPAELAHEIRWKLDLFREAFAARRDAKPVRLPDGSETDAGELFANDFAKAVLEFAAALQPGWMSRGSCASWLIDQAKLPRPSSWETPASLFEPLIADVPELTRRLSHTIEENESLGGYVRPENVPAMLRFFEEHASALGGTAEESWERLELKKITEALADSARRGFAFCEATEVYSGPLGVMN